MDVDYMKIFRQIGSMNNLIATRQLKILQEEISEWVISNSCGGIVIGPPRCGKTCAIRYCSEELRKMYGISLPIYHYTATDHIPTQKTFYESLLISLGHEDASKGNANQMRMRLVNRIVANALETEYQLAILWIDEAYLLNEKEYLWLIDIYNELAMNDVQFTVILVGTKELHDLKKGFIKAGKQQIIQRFMAHEVEFHGIETAADLAVCMKSVDVPISLGNTTAPGSLSEIFFPDAFSSGKHFSDATADYWQALRHLKEKNKITTNYLTMKCFIDTITYCVRHFGIQNEKKRIFFPTEKEWTEALINSGFVSTQI